MASLIIFLISFSSFFALSLNAAAIPPKTKEIEHDDYKWVTIEEIKEIEDTKIPIYLLEKALEMSKNAR